MKRVGHLWSSVVSWPNLLEAYYRAAKGKKYSPPVIKFAADLEQNLLSVQTKLLMGQINGGTYQHFYIYEPKKRYISAPAFEDQVVHHALINSCGLYFEKYQIYDSYACRKHKGTHAALQRAAGYSAKYAWYLKLDVRQYFASIDHHRLNIQLRRMFKDPQVLDLLHRIIAGYHTDPGQGLPIGNLTSQYLANHYLAPVDHLIKEKLQVPGYVRYMDDMVLWSSDRDVLKKAFAAIRQMVADELNLVLKPPLYNRVQRGLVFLGYRIYPDQMLLSTRSKLRFRRKSKFYQHQWQRGAWDENTCRVHFSALSAFTRLADTYNMRKLMLEKLIRS